MKLSIIIPCYNEAGTIEDLVARVINANVGNLDSELVIVDDGSSDGSLDLIEALASNDKSIVVASHPTNRGKGAAVRTGMGFASGDILLVQDADLEYDPADYLKLLEPILKNNADVVYGSRFRGGDSTRVLYFWHSIGNRVLTQLSNMLTNLNLSDMECCYKVFHSWVVEKISLRENGFGFEPEITAKISRLTPQPRIYEVGIGYAGRTYEDGKKITWKDGIWAIWCIFRYNILD